MADAWGGAVRDWRGGVSAWVQSETSTTATIRVVARWQSIGYGFQVNNGNTACVECDGQSSGWVGVGGVYAGTGQTVTKDMLVRDFTVSKRYGGGRNVTCYGGFHLGGFQVGTSGASCSVWVGGMPYSRPKPPRGLSASRRSDTEAALSWQADYTGLDGAYPWTNVLIERRTDSGGWSQIAQLNWDALSYSDKGISAGHRYDYRARAKGQGGLSDYATAGGPVYTTPQSPSGCAVSRVSDSSQRVAWSVAGNAAETYGGVAVERSTDGGGWGQVAKLGGSATNYTDNGTAANHRYQYRARAYSPNNLWSGYASSGYVYTTPAAPATVSASATGPTGVSVTATGLPRWADSYQVEHRAASGSWGETKAASGFPVAMQSTAGVNYYRVRAGRGGLWSGWRESAGITTVAVPLAPTITGVSAVYALGTEAVVSWTANHPDGSAQTAAEIEVEKPDGSTFTVSVDGGGKTAGVELAEIGTWRLRARTHGAHSDWGAWSGYTEVSVAAPPVVTITRPATDADVVDVVPFEARWDVVDSTGVSSQALRLFGPDGALLHSVELGPDARSYEFRAGTYLPANLSAYRVEVSVRGGSTLTGGAERGFEVDYAEPATPSVELSYTPELCAEVSVRFGLDGWELRGSTLVSPELLIEGDGIPVTSGIEFVADGTVAIGGVMPTVSASVVRVMPDGSQWLVAGDMADGETARDPLPPLCTDYKYVVTAFSETGTSISVEVPARVEASEVAINFGPAAARLITLAYDVEWSRDYELSTELMDFADGGEAGGLPTAYTTGAAKVTWSISGTAMGVDARDALDALARRHAVAWVRDPHGQRALCAIGLGLSGSVPRDVAGVSLSLTETAWREAWDG